ncbi:hypothetical protein N7491_001413 [Penicillium cf. griseofulvum]|uniref:C2H2-type domain-containing protein n=1 Tax=Penicillium cf. griseofulvum TaxID=2972120 RepID=A0A9W9MBD2_9EURO|nr:hypothetical protein N7472_006543 [Penicillium cf. griseofulvum]KAJ5445331.1 hypothetical protein N7491_001413 [Penicillium cf. griseofulvum]KAJ5447049.1 hypothetical protein N7445_001870 [Penicillium cf. griseofulvum]
MALCVPCGKHFTTQHALGQHLQSSKHRCEDCNRFFSSTRSKEQHIKSSQNHSIRTQRSMADNLHPHPLRHDPKTNDQTLGLMVGATVYGIISPYTGIPRTTVAPVFKMACQLRFMKPDVDMPLRRIDTQLGHGVISALIEAALRLLPPESTPEGKLEAKERMQQKMERAFLREMAFVDQTRDFGHQILTEDEQKKLRLRPTPDIRFLEPVLIHGHLCHWIEYKSYFGFKANPFIASCCDGATDACQWHKHLYC